MTYPFIRTTYRRRMAALALDWLACYAIVAALSGGINTMSPNSSLYVLALFFIQVWVLIALQGATLGHRLFGMKVVRFEDGAAINPWQALIRTILLVLVVTAVTFDENGRGIHERLSGSVLTRS
ncbi:MAG: RDD family protein [Actinomycetales bacterium]|nr:RDD family protein [Actinomycetales bacterium]